AILTDHASYGIRLSPSVPGLRGAIWSTIPNPHPEWEVEFSIRVTGTHVGGGRGMAFWYTKDRNVVGPVLGNHDLWDGLGVLLDSAGTSQQVGRVFGTELGERNGQDEWEYEIHFVNPAIAVVTGLTSPLRSPPPPASTHTAQCPRRSGHPQRWRAVHPLDLALGWCYRDFRYSDNPVRTKITYRNNTIEIWMDPFKGRGEYALCIKRTGIKLPTGYYFGISASSQHPADDHDVHSFETYQLNPPVKNMVRSPNLPNRSFRSHSHPEPNRIELQHPLRPLEQEKIDKGETWKALDEEELKRIDEIRARVEKMQQDKLQNQTDELSDRFLSLGAVVSNQHRMVDALDLLTKQLQALGAPSAQQISEGGVVAAGGIKKDGETSAAGQAAIDELGQKLSRRLDTLSSVLDALKEDVARTNKLHTETLQRMQETLSRIETGMKGMDSRLTAQVSVAQNKISEAARSTTEAAQGTTYKFLIYIFWLLVAQMVLMGGFYMYGKRAEKNEKKFI
ncbi:concanavalin A-like lectin/glucanase domain-containing protein, partial [Jimgerdemannia flammicorona]